MGRIPEYRARTGFEWPFATDLIYGLHRESPPKLAAGLEEAPLIGSPISRPFPENTESEYASDELSCQGRFRDIDDLQVVDIELGRT